MTIDINSIVRLREPGLGEQWIGRERYLVRGGAVVAVPMMPGDDLEIVDPEGRQPALVFAFDASGGNVTAALGVEPNISAASHRPDAGC